MYEKKKKENRRTRAIVETRNSRYRRCRRRCRCLALFCPTTAPSLPPYFHCPSFFIVRWFVRLDNHAKWAVPTAAARSSARPRHTCRQSAQIQSPFHGTAKANVRSSAPFGVGTGKMGKTIRRAEETPDLASLQRVYQFILTRMQRGVALVAATATIYHASPSRSGRSASCSTTSRARWPTAGMAPTGLWPTATRAARP
ncbi:hypothetical protein [Pandoravirus japonicus]|uniref:Uncharacterized protein n=1 Tax=Pandoravirus japonicus TaxID=2823154 RepID=A0A811BPH1_9VIRU|nr:hypothetical protein [Pandoravirus japonicus]